MTLPRRQLLELVAAGSVLLAGCSSSDDDGDPVEETSSVAMADSQFDPRNISVDTGTTVTWTNDDDTAHTVTNASDNWENDTEVAGGAETTHTFEESGVYDVFCRFHGSADLSGMSMKIGVGDATIDDPLGSDGGDDTAGGY